MIDKSKYYQQKIAVLGLSVEGIDSVKFLLNEGAVVSCLDRRSQDELQESYPILAKLNVEFHLGKDYLKNLERYDLIVRTPGAALFLSEFSEIQKKGQKITSLTKIFFDECLSPIIGVSGTKGKGTTVSLIGDMLKKSGFKTYIGGNIGQPLLSQVRKIEANDRVVLELSSFQLEDLHKSPRVAVVLNITQEHLNNMDPLATNYHKSKADYIKAKESLVKYQKADDFCVINADFPVPLTFIQKTKAKVFMFSKNQKVFGAYVKNNYIMLNIDQELNIVHTKDLLLRGKHNWENIMAASLAAYLTGAKLDQVRESCKTFKGLEHRLELVGEKNGVKFYNDSFSTTPETTIAAIKSFTENIILIVGGSDKGSDFTDLGRELINSNVKTCILIGLMADKIELALNTANKNAKIKKQIKIIRNLKSMPQIVDLAYKESHLGDVILLSPACASFDMFKNYKDRGNQFKIYVQQMA